MIDFNFKSLSGLGTSEKANICFPIVGTNGTKHGYVKNQFGEITPNATLQGIDIYEATWQSDGTVIISFGDSGNSEPDNIKEILVTHHMIPKQDIALWDATNIEYTYNNIDLTDYLIANPDDNCMWIEFVPKILISYSFSTVFTGVKE